MTLSWRMWKRCNRRGIEGSKALKQEDMQLTIPIHFRCPISLDLMKDPVTLSTGITYDRESIEKWIEGGGKGTCPVTNQVLGTFDLIPNHFLRRMIQDWCVDKKSCGIERIPTPRVPVDPNEVSAICSRMEVAMRNGDARKCRELLGKIDCMAKESDRNKRCIMRNNGIVPTLATMFESFDSNAVLQGEILSALTWTSVLDQEGISNLKSEVSLSAMVRFLKFEDDLSARQNAICVLRELIYVDQRCLERLMGIEEIEETLFHIVKVPISPKATKASLVIIHHMISSSAEPSATSTMKFVQMGLLPLIIEMLVECDKSLCEKALNVIDSICNWKEGRKSSYNSALAIPVIVKKLLRVSTVATELAVSTLWKLCLGENKNALVEAVQFGAFQKLLVVLQIQISEGTKEKVTELLKLINLNRDQLDCFDPSLGFRYIKRPDDL